MHGRRTRHQQGWLRHDLLNKLRLFATEFFLESGGAPNLFELKDSDVFTDEELSTIATVSQSRTRRSGGVLPGITIVASGDGYHFFPDGGNV